jgi:hypothetical protein
MKVTGRPPTSPEALIAACSVYTDTRTSSLFPDKFPNVAESPFIRMGWKVLHSGKDLDWSEMRDLLDTGWVYAVVDDGTTTLSGNPSSHARVIYGASADNRWGGPVMNTIDPILADFDWKKSDTQKQKIMLGFAADLLTSDEVKDRKGWLVRTGSGNTQFRWCPKG